MARPRLAGVHPMNGARGWIVGDALAARATQFLIAALASAVAAYLIAKGEFRTLTALGLVFATAGAMLRWPSLTIVALLIICQELDPAQGFGGPSASGLLFLGHQVYFKTVARLSLLTLVV